jgi:hypothetical protein
LVGFVGFIKQRIVNFDPECALGRLQISSEAALC